MRNAEDWGGGADVLTPRAGSIPKLTLTAQYLL
jgi:hypothetical protein